MTLSALATALKTVLDQAATARVDRDVLEHAAVAADTSMGYGPDRRERLRAAIDELETAGVIELPRTSSAFETRPSPPLPNWVRRTNAPQRQRTVVALRLWRAELQAAAAMARTGADRELLETISAFLHEGGAQRPMVPSRERSLALFGDEKRLDALRRHRFFTTGAINLDLLRCFDVPLPFPSTYLDGPAAEPVPVPLLIAENHHTYISLVEAARNAVDAGHPPLHVGWGSGNAFSNAVQSTHRLDPQVACVYYFGDLDVGGLAAAIAVTETMRGSQIPVVPASGLYRLLLAAGVPRPVKAIDSGRAAKLAAWIGPEFATDVEALLTSGIALRQEAVGTELLRTTGLPPLASFEYPVR